VSTRLHPAEELQRAIEALSRQSSAAARYRLGVLYIALHGWTPKTQVLDSAYEQLVRAINLRPRHARSHALRGYVLDLNHDEKGALAAFREARRLAPRDKVLEVYVFRLLAALACEKEAFAAMKAAALRHGVDLAKLRRDLKKAGMPTDARTHLQAFLHAPNFLKSSIEREAERILNALQPGRARAGAAAEKARCEEDQKALQRSFDASRVPPDVRRLARWAARYGIGDDVCRPYLLKRLSKKRRAALIRDVERCAPAIKAWLASFGDAVKPAEAAACLYLALGVEEMRG